VTAAAANAPTPISREVGTLRRQDNTRCQVDSSIGGTGSCSLLTISVHTGPA
jgi:hypothetical protein